jgi:peroxiredoxin
VFYRGDWCPFCNLTLHRLQHQLAGLRELGGYLIAISPQAPDHALPLAEKHGLALSVLTDLTQETIAAYHLRYTVPPTLQELFVNKLGNDLREQNADGSWHLPVPGTFVIDHDGIIRARFVDADFRRRTEPADLLAAVRQLVDGAQ